MVRVKSKRVGGFPIYVSCQHSEKDGAYRVRIRFRPRVKSVAMDGTGLLTRLPMIRSAYGITQEFKSENCGTMITLVQTEVRIC